MTQLHIYKKDRPHSMKNLLVIFFILTMIVPAASQRRTDLPFKVDGKWWYNLDGEKFGPFFWVSDLAKNKDKWLFISENKDDSNKSTYRAHTNAGNKDGYGPYDYINYRIAGFSPGGRFFYFMAFKGDDQTSDQKYYFVINGKEYGPFTNVTRKVEFFCDDEIWTFKAVRDGKFRGRWHMGGKTRLYVMGKEYDILTRPAGFWVESVKKVSDNRYEIKISVDVGSRQTFKKIYYEKP